jgi:hypothetical protein
LPFKCNLQRYSEVSVSSLHDDFGMMGGGESRRYGSDWRWLCQSVVGLCTLNPVDP